MRVYRFKDGASDKIWAIEFHSSEPRYRVFWGKYGSRLVEKEYDLNGAKFKKAHDRADEKRRKGYQLIPDGWINPSHQFVRGPRGRLPSWDSVVRYEEVSVKKEPIKTFDARKILSEGLDSHVEDLFF